MFTILVLLCAFCDCCKNKKHAINPIPPEITRIGPTVASLKGSTRKSTNRNIHYSSSSLFFLTSKLSEASTESSLKTDSKAISATIEQSHDEQLQVKVNSTNHLTCTSSTHLTPVSSQLSGRSIGSVMIVPFEKYKRTDEDWHHFFSEQGADVIWKQLKQMQGNSRHWITGEFNFECLTGKATKKRVYVITKGIIDYLAQHNIPIKNLFLIGHAASKNQLDALPSNIQKLTTLHQLNLNNHVLTTLPEELNCLNRLTSLNIKNNQLKYLPSALYDWLLQGINIQIDKNPWLLEEDIKKLPIQRINNQLLGYCMGKEIVFFAVVCNNNGDINKLPFVILSRESTSMAINESSIMHSTSMTATSSSSNMEHTIYSNLNQASIISKPEEDLLVQVKSKIKNVLESDSLTSRDTNSQTDINFRLSNRQGTHEFTENTTTQEMNDINNNNTQKTRLVSDSEQDKELEQRALSSSEPIIPTEEPKDNTA